MPEWICKDCGYEARDKYSMERHLNRKYPCNSIGIASKQKLVVKKINHVKEDDLKETPVKQMNYKLKIRTNNEKGKLVKE
jgi:hypothetical protein